MRVIVAGSRGITDAAVVETAINDSGFAISSVVCGGAAGVDSLGLAWATRNGIRVSMFEANWNLHGKRAGYLRNVEMAENADALIAVWDGNSRGTKHMIDIAKRKGLKVFVREVTP